MSVQRRVASFTPLPATHSGCTPLSCPLSKPITELPHKCELTSLPPVTLHYPFSGITPWSCPLSQQVTELAATPPT